MNKIIKNKLLLLVVILLGSFIFSVPTFALDLEDMKSRALLTDLYYCYLNDGMKINTKPLEEISKFSDIAKTGTSVSLPNGLEIGRAHV